MRSWFLSLALLALVSPLLAAELDPLLANPKFWTLGQTDFEKLEEARVFRWTSSAHDSSRAGETELTLFGFPVVEAVVRFEGGKVSSFTPVIYARGDSGGLSKEKFTALVKASVDSVTKYAKVAPVVRGKDPTSAVKAEGVIWSAPAAKYLLEYSFTAEMKSRDIPFRAEFVRLKVTPPEQKTSLLASAQSAPKAKFSGPAHVKKEPSGDVVITDVPMVDQGQKGYCAVACAERMMRYYGVQTDANEIAQIANSSAEGGTNPEAMMEALKKLAARLHVRVRSIEEFNVKEILALIAEYNRAAKKGGATPLPDQGHMLDVAHIFHSMDAGVLKEVRTKSKADTSRFLRNVQTQIDLGIPLLWSVMLGVVKEPQIPQSAGGHMRLIIGYNAKTEEIMYTDSWGAGHELKRMALADAVTMTTGLTRLEPF